MIGVLSEAEIYSAQFSHDGQRVVTASSDMTARMWDAVSGKPVGDPRSIKAGFIQRSLVPTVSG
jgi:WD40 repeat protein